LGQPIRADVRERFRKIEARVTAAVTAEQAALGRRRPPPPKLKAGQNWRGGGGRISRAASDGPAPAVAETTPREDELATADAAALLGVSLPSFCRIRLDQQIAPVRRVGPWISTAARTSRRCAGSATTPPARCRRRPAP
jgi:hypothetical protein